MWENGDTTKPPSEFRMTVHLFGAGSSPGCANYGLKQIADDDEEEFGAEAASFARDDFYVDDGLKSVNSVSEAVWLIKGTKDLCTRGGLRLHPARIKNLDTRKDDNLPVERALWHRMVRRIRHLPASSHPTEQTPPPDAEFYPPLVPYMNQ